MTIHDPMAKRKTVTRTVRIDEAYDKILKNEAAREGISVNSLVDKIFRQYAHSYRYFRGQAAIIISFPTLNSLLQYLEISEMKELGKKMGKERPKNLLLKRGLPITYDALLWYITDTLGDTAGWFQARYNQLEDRDLIHLSHTLGEKWGTFVTSYMDSLFREILGVIPDVEMVGSSITISLDKDQIRSLKK
jgi:hypothetical protein